MVIALNTYYGGQSYTEMQNELEKQLAEDGRAVEAVYY
jgi:hypothetical protein